MPGILCLWLHVLTDAVGKLQMQTPSVKLEPESLDVCLFLPSFSQPLKKYHTRLEVFFKTTFCLKCKIDIFLLASPWLH